MKLVLAASASLLLCSLAFAQDREQEPDLDMLMENRTFTRDSATLLYRLLKPDGYQDDGADRYPLVIFLHGAGERGADNQSQLCNGVEEFAKDSIRTKHPCFLAVPQCPPEKSWAALRGTRQSPIFAEQPTEQGALVLELIDALCKEYRIDEDRIYLTGLSMGGYGTWDLAYRNPQRFAAALPVCGGGDPAQAAKLVGLPIWAFHGDKDQVVPAERSREMVDAVKKAGGTPEYTEYEGVGHNAWTPTYRNEEVLDWLFKQKKQK